MSDSHHFSNAGSLTDSVIMATADYRRVARIEREVEISKGG